MRSLHRTSGIYQITFASGGRYIGSSNRIGYRWNGHLSMLKRGRHKNRHIQKAWNKHGADGIEFRVLIVCRTEDLVLYEQIAIDALRPEYNLCPFAGRVDGIIRSAEYRAAAASRMLGTKQSEETRAKQSLSKMGHSVSEDTRLKLAAQRGWRHSEDAKEKMRGRTLSSEHRTKIAAANAGNQQRLGATLSADARGRISAKLKGRERSPEAIAKQKATCAAKHELRARASTTGESS